MASHRVLLATDIPFWHRSTGAEQRIFSLANFLSNEPFSLRVFYLGNTHPPDNQFELVCFDSSRPPKRPFKKAHWYFDAIINRLTGDDSEPDTKDKRSMRLDDYRWRWASEQFMETVRVFDPDTIVVEYITMAYLVESIDRSTATRPRLVLDTHDVLHKRCEQYRNANRVHWLEVDREQEARALDLFDLVIAIQPEEAKQFQELCVNPEVVVAGHCIVESDLPDSNSEEDGSFSSSEITVGYFGSSNATNIDGMKEFIETAWPAITSQCQKKIRLLVAGSIVDSELAVQLDSDALITGRRNVEGLADFYDRVDIVINPVSYGTGLKIKNVEAISFGKPLVTTMAGFAGMPVASKSCCMVVDAINQMSDAICVLANDPQKRIEMAGRSRETAQSAFSEETVFAPLRARLLRSEN